MGKYQIRWVGKKLKWVYLLTHLQLLFENIVKSAKHTQSSLLQPFYLHSKSDLETWFNLLIHEWDYKSTVGFKET